MPGGRLPVEHRDLSLFLQKVRDFFLLRNREGFGHTKYLTACRFEDTQAPRSYRPPVPDGGTLPGNYYKVENYYYLGRDGRRFVPAPPVVFDQTKSLLAENSRAPKLKAEPKAAVDFKLPTPVPGIGYKWNRVRKNELPFIKQIPELKDLE